MTSTRHQLLRLCAAVVVLVTTGIQGCATTGDQAPLDTSGKPQANEWPELVASAMEAGNELRAKASAKAASGEPAQAADLFLMATDRYLIAGRYDLATNQLADTRKFYLSDTGKARYQVLKERFKAVATRGDDSGFGRIETARRLETRAQRLQAANYRLPALRIRVLRELLLDTPEAIRANQNAIWTLVNSFSSKQLATLPDDATDGLVSWWSLGYVIKTRQGKALAGALDWWRKQYPGYASSNLVLSDLGTTTAVATTGVDEPVIDLIGTELPQNPSNVALILPLSGRYGAAAKAVQAGFEAADRESGSTLVTQIIDPETEGVLAAYDQAIAAGAELVIGPLQKPAVTQLATEGAVSAAVLALNAVPDISLPAGFVMFGLVPEQEAREVAKRAVADGKLRAALLVPNNDWGARIGLAFNEAYESYGGVVVASGDYRPGVNDLGRDVQKLLRSNTQEPLWRDVGSYESANRSTYENDAKTLRWTSRDQQIDMVFVAAFPRDARILRPSLQFHHAIRLPVYATSHSYSGRPNPRFDADLNGVTFCDMPALLQPPTELPADGDAVAAADLRRYPQRLVALGRDARLLVDNLAVLQGDRSLQIEGATGKLSLVGTGIERELSCAQFIDGQAVLLPPVEMSEPDLFLTDPEADLAIPLMEAVSDQGAEQSMGVVNPIPAGGGATGIPQPMAPASQ